MLGIVKVIILSMVMLVQHNQASGFFSSTITQFNKSEIAKLENKIRVPTRFSTKNGEIHFTFDSYDGCEAYNIYAAYGGSHNFTIVTFERWFILSYSIWTVTPGKCKVPSNPDEVVVVCTHSSRKPLYRSDFIISQPEPESYVSCEICFIFIFIFCIYLLLL